VLSQAQGAPRAGATAYRGPLDALTTIIRKARGRAPAALRWHQHSRCNAHPSVHRRKG
jgi:hypothetical protein